MRLKGDAHNVGTYASYNVAGAHARRSKSHNTAPAGRTKLLWLEATLTYYPIVLHLDITLYSIAYPTTPLPPS